MKPKIWLSSPHMGMMEQVFVKEAFDTNWIAPLGPHVNGFEADLQAFTGASHAAALSSGTAALHLALILLGVKAGDEVICQSFTFSASANPIVYQGATPVFVDSEKDTWNMRPEYLDAAIADRIAKGRKPKAIIAVHLYGMPAKMEAIAAVAAKYDIPLIEDAAEALGSHINGQMCGTFGKLNILSFNGNKIITTSGGGALLSEDGELIAKARFLATQARDNAPHYQHSYIGYNYRMSNVVAAIGRGQMVVLNERIAARRANYERYVKLFGEINAKGFHIELLPEPEGFFSNRWLTTITIDPAKNKGITREDVRLALDVENIESRPLWKPMHLQPVFADAPFYGDGTSEKLFDQGLCLPSGSNLGVEDWMRIEEVLGRVF
ncbi:MAG: aminotransferase class I/II-fold pyridoxal phosphate-dependent enzyme [Bacteroidetes bacterium]|nr:aminotransferase class I/II-fold pyridoxal phosphate-dependent enzyme [Bacteroidota bacterium]